ncbi:MAG TPA: hypothetical protein VLA99_00350 [Nitrospiraceae bacterium]|nr:hypothetical protein [Nitrospiraceae bacterium]
MRSMIVVKATKKSEAGVLPQEHGIAAATSHEELKTAEVRRLFEPDDFGPGEALNSFVNWKSAKEALITTDQLLINLWTTLERRPAWRQRTTPFLLGITA